MSCACIYIRATLSVCFELMSIELPYLSCVSKSVCMSLVATVLYPLILHLILNPCFVCRGVKRKEVKEWLLHCL